MHLLAPNTGRMTATLSAEEIKDLRTARGWSQEDLAAKIGVGKNTVCNWETGRSTPRISLNLLRRVLTQSDTDDGTPCCPTCGRPPGPVLRHVTDEQLLAEVSRRFAH